MKVLALLLLCCSAAFAQHPTRTPVAFQCTCPDPIGSLFATAFRDALAASPRYIQTAKAKDVDGKAPDGSDLYAHHWKVSVVSEDPTKGQTGEVSVLSELILIGDDFYVTHLVRSCPRESVTTCAASVLADLDSQVTN